MTNETRSRMTESGARLHRLVTGRDAPWGRRLALIIALAATYVAGFNGLGTNAGQWGVLPLTLLGLGLLVGVFLLLKGSYLVRVLGLALGIAIVLLIEHNWAAIAQSWNSIRPLSLSLTIGAVVLALLFVWWLLPSRSANTRRRTAQPPAPNPPATPTPRPRAAWPGSTDDQTLMSFPVPDPAPLSRPAQPRPERSDPWSAPIAPSPSSQPTPPRPE